jgi:hypothetical protein
LLLAGEIAGEASAQVAGMHCCGQERSPAQGVARKASSELSLVQAPASKKAKGGLRQRDP